METPGCLNMFERTVFLCKLDVNCNCVRDYITHPLETGS